MPVCPMVKSHQHSFQLTGNLLTQQAASPDMCWAGPVSCLWAGVLSLDGSTSLAEGFDVCLDRLGRHAAPDRRLPCLLVEGQGGLHPGASERAVVREQGPVLLRGQLLVGGNGKAFGSSKASTNMAVIDTADTPGYLTGVWHRWKTGLASSAGPVNRALTHGH